MLSTLQIVLLSVAGAMAVASIVFMVLFIIEITLEHKEKTEEVVVKSVFAQEEEKKEEEETSVNAMLENLENQTKEEVVEEKPAEPHVIVINNIVGATEPAKEEKVEEKEEVVEEKPAEPDRIVEVIDNTQVIDYKERLEKVLKNKDKIEKDLAKLQKSILRYERTKRRRNRNQKMLDRRAGELTNLNLVMYSVTDIKNVDEEKKAKQEELTAHIAELKASIQDADEFIESNKEKNDHNVKMAKFLIQERNRYNEEIAEIEKIINKEDEE